jgi:hypothetical protein
MRLALLPAVLLVACGTAKTTPTYEKDLKPLFAAHCVSCHTAGGIAPFALTTFEEVTAVKDAVQQAVESRRMPPYLAGADCTAYSDDERLSADEIAQVTAWVAAGAPRGAKTADLPAATQPTLPRVDLELSMPEVYSPHQSPDDYHCFVLDFPGAADQFVTGFHVKPGNPRVVHHVIAFLIQPDKAQQVAALDAAEPGPGYTCFGGPGGNNSSVSWLGSWAPGGRASMFPDGTGLLVKPGSKVVMQVHYNTAAAPEGERDDQTSIELALASSVKSRAWIIPWSSPEWARRGNMPIPAGQADVMHTWSLDPTQVLSYLTSNQLTNGQGIRIYSAGFHQHLLGTSGHLEIIRGDGTKECLLDVPRWDFHWQRSYSLEKTKLFRPGDQLGITCHWDNTEANQPVIGGVKRAARDVNWGEGTADEMCLGTFYISE